MRRVTALMNRRFGRDQLPLQCFLELRQAGHLFRSRNGCQNGAVPIATKKWCMKFSWISVLVAYYLLLKLPSLSLWGPE